MKMFILMIRFLCGAEISDKPCFLDGAIVLTSSIKNLENDLKIRTLVTDTFYTLPEKHCPT